MDVRRWENKTRMRQVRIRALNSQDPNFYVRT